VAGTILCAFFACPGASLFWCVVYRLLGLKRYRFLLGWEGACIGGGTDALFRHEWAWAIGAGASLAVAVAVWWWRRRKGRRRAAAALGAKARARIAAMVGAMRERARPRPVLRPGWQGA
jgi:hypothetical protein